MSESLYPPTHLVACQSHLARKVGRDDHDGKRRAAVSGGIDDFLRSALSQKTHKMLNRHAVAQLLLYPLVDRVHVEWVMGLSRFISTTRRVVVSNDVLYFLTHLTKAKVRRAHRINLTTMSLRTSLQTQALRLRPCALESASRAMSSASTYTPRGAGNATPVPRPIRPASPYFYTGKPEFNEALVHLHKVLEKSERDLRNEYIWPLPSGFPRPPPHNMTWKNETTLGKLKSREVSRLHSTLSKLARMRQVASMSGSYDIASRIDQAIEPFGSTAHADRMAAKKAKLGNQDKTDEFGRAYALGARKSSSARVWIIPTAAGREYLPAEGDAAVEIDVEEVDVKSETGEVEVAAVEVEVKATPEATPVPLENLPIPTSQVLINHLPLPSHFGRPIDRDTVLRPLRITGLLGAYNVFALVRGGGTTGQSQALSMAIARALYRIRPETYDTLRNDNAMYRDPRSVERKQTNRVKARKMVSGEAALLTTANLGQALVHCIACSIHFSSADVLTRRGCVTGWWCYLTSGNCNSKGSSSTGEAGTESRCVLMRGDMVLGRGC